MTVTKEARPAGVQDDQPGFFIAFFIIFFYSEASLKKAQLSVVNDGIGFEEAIMNLRNATGIIFALGFCSWGTGCASTPPKAKITQDIRLESQIAKKDSVQVFLTTAASVIIPETDKTRLTDTIISRIAARKNLNVMAGERKSFRVDIFMTQYEEGSAMARLLLGGFGGQKKISAEVQLVELPDRRQAGAFSIKKTSFYNGAQALTGKMEGIEPAFAEGVAEALIFRISEGQESNGTPAIPVVLFYDDLTGVDGRIGGSSLPSVEVVENTSQLPAAFMISSLNRLNILRREGQFGWQTEEPVREDLTTLKDTVALLCMQKISDGTSPGIPSLSGMTHLHSSIGRAGLRALGPFALGSTGFKAPGVYMVKQYGRLISVVTSGEGTMTWIWLIPALRAEYEIEFKPESRQVMFNQYVKIRVE